MDDDDPQRRSGVRLRMGVIAGLMVAGLLAVVGRVYYLQTVKREKLVDWARDQTSETVELRASRGNIVDRNGVELAVSTDVPSLYARPTRIDDPDGAARALSRHLEAGEDELSEKLNSDRGFVWLQRKVQPPTAEAVRELEIRGVGSVTEHKRYYPLGNRAGELLGFVGLDGHGLEGLERTYDETLSGETYEFSGMRDARGRTILSKRVPDLGKLQGNSLKLTIDERIQRTTERILRSRVETYRAEAAYGVVLDVDTGEVLAMATTPAFDPNRFREFEPSDWKLRPVTDAYEPGSVFKPFVLAAAIEEQTVSLRTTFDCEEGAIRIGDYVVRDTHAHETLTAAQIIQKSSNIGAYKIARTIGRGRLYDYIRAFGFGSRTGIGLRGEQPGIVRPPGGWAEVTFANIAFGQGISATPLQVASALATVANGGLLLEPRVVSEVREPDGTVERETKPRLVRRVISEETATDVSKAMSLVTLESGTGTNAALQDFTVAGKTGTAQKVDPETGAYGDDMWIASFAGFAPAEDPEVLALVMVDEPKKNHYGGVVAAPAVRKILDKSLSVRGTTPVPADEEFERLQYVDADDVDSEASPAARADRTADDRSDRSVGRNSSGRAEVLPAIPVGGRQRFGPDSRVDVEGSGVPDLRGLTLRAALRRAADRGYHPRVEGWGRVVAQRPRPGSELPAGENLSLVLAPRRSRASGGPRPARGERDDSADR